MGNMEKKKLFLKKWRYTVKKRNYFWKKEVDRSGKWYRKTQENSEFQTGKQWKKIIFEKSEVDKFEETIYSPCPN